MMHNDAHATEYAARSAPGAGRQQMIAWLALVLAVALVVTLYLSLSLAVSSDPLLMPLDDTYIHFQYARQWAHGQPMVYHDGDPATSGGTSLIYPPLLAIGYLVGFDGWALVYWALGINVLCFLGSAWLVYLIGRQVSIAPPGHVYRPGHALLLALAFAMSGPFVWAALSGMETALFVFIVLLALYAVQQNRLLWAVGAAAAMTLTRPEGVVLAAIAMFALALRVRWPAVWSVRVRRVGFLVLPVLVALAQPLINLLATGSTSSSGLRAKSHLYNTSVPLEQRLGDILEFFGRMWKELFTGVSADWGTFTPWLLVVMAFAALAVGVLVAWRQRRVTLALVMLVWMLGLTAGVATLDTAFWQFKRYQLPVMALFFPAAAWGSALQGQWLARDLRRRWAQWAIPVIILIASALTAFSFAHKYAVNVRVVRDQQVPMARWVRDHIPQDERIAVHDVGLMGYFSAHPLYDVVGLTLPGPARSWRQGPGAIYEHMAHSDYRPGYFAIYPDVQGLRYLVDAGVMGEVLAEFPLDLPQYNVAAALDYQAVYTADWSTTRKTEQVGQTTTRDFLAQMDDLALVDQLDVANLESEAAHDYEWWQDAQPQGFVTEVYRNVYHACEFEDPLDCWATDGGRVLTGGEEFTLATTLGEDLLLVSRLHGRASVPLTITVTSGGERAVVSRVQPELPGRWVEVATWVPGDLIAGATTHVRIEAQSGEPKQAYMPYYHWAYQGTLASAQRPEREPVAVFSPSADTPIALLDYAVTSSSGQVSVTLEWESGATGAGDDGVSATDSARDGVVFVHLYNHVNIHTEPVAQVVERPAGGVLPPANWLPGTVEETHVIALPGDLPPGDYEVALGLFDALTGARYEVRADDLMVDDNRLLLGEITVEEFSGED